MNRKIEIIRILNNILIVYTVATVLFVAFQMPVGTAVLTGNVSLIAFVIMTEIISAFCGNFILFALFHVLAGMLCIWLSGFLVSTAIVVYVAGGMEVDSIYTVLRVLVMIVITAVSIYSRLDGKPRYHPEISEAFLFVGLFVLCLVAKQPDAIPVVLVGEMIWAVLCIIFYNIRQIIGALIPFKDRDYVPYEAIEKTNSLMVGLSVLITVVLMFLCALLDYGKEIVAFLRRAFLTFMRWIFSFIDINYQNDFIPPEEVPMESEAGYMIPEIEPDDSIWHTIWQVLYWIIAGIVLICVFILLIKMIKAFYKLFNSSRKGIRDRLAKDKIEFLNPLNNDEKVRALSTNKKMTLFERLTPAGRVRLLFMKYIENGMRLDSISKADSPKEMEERAYGERKVRAYSIYEKARYSSEEVTAEDVKEMRSFKN